MFKGETLLVTFIVVIMAMTAVTLTADSADAVDTEGYYESQLSNTYQEEMLSDLEKLTGPGSATVTVPSSVLGTGEDRIRNFCMPVYCAYMLQNPGSIWLDTQYEMNYVGSSSVQVTLTLKLNSVYSDYDNMMDEVDAKIATIPIDTSSRYNAVKDVHDYLTNNVTYNLNATHGHTLYGAIVDGEGVCEAYSEAFKYICDGLGIPVVNAPGRGTNSTGTEGHMWSYVQMDDDKWYAMDVTWDDPTGGSPCYDFFLIGGNTVNHSMTFNSNHKAFTPETSYPDFEAPSASSTDFPLRPNNESYTYPVVISGSVTYSVGNLETLAAYAGDYGRVSFESSGVGKIVLDAEALKKLSNQAGSTGLTVNLSSESRDINGKTQTVLSADLLIGGGSASITGAGIQVWIPGSGQAYFIYADGTLSDVLESTASGSYMVVTMSSGSGDYTVMQSSSSLPISMNMILIIVVLLVIVIAAAAMASRSRKKRRSA